jgi:predicted nucleotidyltransferase
MSTSQARGAHAQHRLVERWVASLTQLAGVETIWLEGSLVDDRANPWSDVDLRVALAD